MRKRADAEVLRCIGLAFITLFHLYFANRCITIERKWRFQCDFVEKKGRFAYRSFAFLLRFI